MAWSIISTFVLDQVYGFQTANTILDNLLALSGARFGKSLGGSDDVGILSASYVRVRSGHSAWINGANTGGMTVEARVQVRTADVATSVTPRIYNVTDAAEAIAGAAYSADTNPNAQTLTFVPVTGLKEYEMQVQGGNATGLIYGLGDIDQYATS